MELIPPNIIKKMQAEIAKQKYVLATANDLHTLAGYVNELLNDQYVPHGAIIVEQNGSINGAPNRTYYQAVVRKSVFESDHDRPYTGPR